MPNVHTLRDIENRGVVEGPLSKHTSSGNRLGSIRESELEKALRGNIKTASDIANDYKDLQNIYLERVKDFNRICSGFNNKFSRLNTANTELKAKYSAEIKSLKSNIKILEREATLAQKASSADKVQILSLEVKIRELEGKLEDIDLERTYYDLDVMGGVIEKPVEMPKLPDWLHDNLRSIVCKIGLKDKVMELDKKLAKEDILEVLQKVILEKDHHLQDANARLKKALSKKDSLLHEANTHIKKHLASFEKKTSPDSFETLQVIGGTDISNTTLALPHLHSITGPEAEEPKDRTASYETSSFGYG
ncbi:hypothetical protein GLOIN_2v1790954 [Rhizophagus irregularis DAOM 181602=DAOM 197198]|uniref:Uncharacterized protein n=1 Tax=Rhizophagus irregularis (strain DAOM 181602 / DAOM 197198 / MUCL 43194) TaxID=747089 RepID=A0A2P4NY26_RHIID|nr:hypothetical protein GLOIN_2v1790954 [Rhizophagus irregularis DAOM 181602=DAOM 197198]POG58039.1 hypothetical protein GLOIN_2v1790954 [Rhizophagus irregularis DAOM 181602=DAOM 197198]|eukprot:XP_025164905.1 hypothetical protein GLOIN_2v1790954 [Rhizophagus irregularis DAOM 181602=DAOM 197198]